VLGEQRGLIRAEQYKLSDAMMQYRIDFILTGDPDGHRPRWSRYSDTTHQVLSLAPGAIRLESDFRAEHHCDLWDSMDRSGLRVRRAADGQ
jgi:carboxylesterase type B